MCVCFERKGARTQATGHSRKHNPQAGHVDGKAVWQAPKAGPAGARSRRHARLTLFPCRRPHAGAACAGILFTGKKTKSSERAVPPRSNLLSNDSARRPGAAAAACVRSTFFVPSSSPCQKPSSHSSQLCTACGRTTAGTKLTPSRVLLALGAPNLRTTTAAPSRVCTCTKRSRNATSSAWIKTSA